MPATPLQGTTPTKTPAKKLHSHKTYYFAKKDYYGYAKVMSKPPSPEALRPFHEFEMRYVDLATNTHVRLQRNIFRKLTRAGLDPQAMLYAGVEGEPVRATGSFGDRKRTWGIPAELFVSEAKEADRTGDLSDLSPMYYIHGSSNAVPTLAVFGKENFYSLHDHEGIVADLLPTEDIHQPYEWELKPGVTMDEAAQAVIYFAHQY
jgi:hypothetical protein